MPGPPSKNAAIRRNKTPAKNTPSGTIVLPIDGREGPTPDWPLPADIELLSECAEAEAAVKALEDEIATTKNDIDAKELAKLRADLRKADSALRKARFLTEETEKAELNLWEDLWTRPVAVAWEITACADSVASYVRLKIRGDSGDKAAARLALNYADRLGLNPTAMLKLRYEMETVDKAESEGIKRREQQRTARPVDIVRDPRQFLEG